MQISIIIAVSNNGVIGRDNQMPWHLSDDLKRFKKLTSSHCIVMGRKTYDSIGKPLPNRTNIIISRNKNLTIEGVVICNNIEQAIDFAKAQNEKELFIIGGGEICRQALSITDTIYLTKVDTELEGDAFFSFDESKWQISEIEYIPKNEKNEFDSEFMILKRK